MLFVVSKLNIYLKKEDAINTSEMSEQEMWLALPAVEKEEKADLLISLARAASFRGSHGQSLELAQAALEIYEEMGAAAPLTEIANCHWGLGFAYRALNQKDKAIEEIDAAIKFYQEANYPFLDDVLRSRAQWCAEMEDWEGTLAANLEAVRQNEIEGNAEWEAKSWLNVGYTYSNMKRFPEAIEAFITAKAKFLELKMVHQVARCDRWLSDCYSDLGEGTQAYEFARRSMNVSELMQNPMPIMFSAFVLGKALLVLEKYEEAELHLTNAYNAATQVDAAEMDWEFIVKIQRQRINLLRSQDRITEAEELESRIATVTEVIEIRNKSEE